MYLFGNSLFLYPGVDWNAPSETLIQFSQNLKRELLKQSNYLLERFLFEFAFGPFSDLIGSSLESALWLFAVVLGFDMSIKCGVGKVPLAAAALIIPSFLVLA